MSILRAERSRRPVIRMAVACHPIEILFNTSENHKLIAEALQQMWRQNLNVAATLVNQEEKVYSIRGVRWIIR